MNILVTGASGFIGSHLVPELEAQGHHVIPTDREECDLSVPENARTLIENETPDYCVHLAARYGRILCRDEPHRAVSDNTAATTELAAACDEFSVPVLYTSSSEVYGDHGEDTITEESELRTPTTIYGLSKRWGEEALKLYLPQDGLTIARLNMVYGPRQRGGYGCCALATFIRDAVEGKPMTVHEGTSRSWLYISDAVRALAMLIDKGGVWHIGNSHERMTLAETAELVTQEVEGATYHLVKPPHGQIRHKVFSTEKLESLGWKPEVDTWEGIRLTVDAARETPIRDYALGAA